MTFTHVILPILAALNLASEKLPCGEWALDHPEEYDSSYFTTIYAQRNEALQKLLPHELHICASQNKNEVNRFLKNHNFEIQTDQSGILTVATILDITLTWDIPGTRTSFNYAYFKDNDFCTGRYKAFRREDGITLDNVRSKPLVELSAKNGDRVSLSQIIFPLISINEIFDVNELLSLRSGRFSIEYAKQQTKFHMDESKAVLQSALVITFTDRQKVQTICGSKIPSTPFMVKIERPGMSLPLVQVAADVPTWQEERTQ